MYTYKCLVASALFLLPVSAAAIQISEEYTFGSEDYKANSIGFYGQVSTGAVAAVSLGAEANTYKTMQFSDVIYSFRLPLSFETAKHVTFIRPFWNPATRNVPSSAYGVFFQNVFEINRDKVEDVSTQFAFNLGAAKQNTTLYFKDGTSIKTDIPEMAYQMQFRQNYFKEFYMVLSGSLFQYLRSVRNSTVPEASLNQSDISLLGVTPAVSKLPSCGWGFEFTRSTTDDSEATAYLGYQYIDYRTDSPSAHSVTIGTRIKLMEKSNLDFSYNWIAAGPETKKNYYRLGLVVGF